MPAPPPELRERPVPLRIPQSAVERPRLRARLDDLPPGGVALLVAPAGSGKSVLLAQWMGSLAGAAGAVTATAAHDDPVVFARALMAAVTAVAPDGGGALASLSAELAPGAGGSLGTAFVNELLDVLESLAVPVVLVIDDVHLMSNSAIWGDLDRIIHDLPDNVQVVLAARWDPPLRAAPLRVQGRLVELRADDLAFDVAESGALIEAVSGRALDDAQTARLVERTDGWAAGLQLAGISLQRATDVDAFIDEFAGSNQFVADYLTEEVLDDLEPDVRRFLLHTAVLEWLSPELCDAVTGEGNAERMLDLLARRSLFIVHGDAGGPLRYHLLFADLLRYSLRTMEPGREPELRRRAATWLLEHDHLADAVEQLLAAGDPAGVLEIIVRHGQVFFEREESATIVRWLTAAQAAYPGVPAELEVNLLAAQMSAHLTGAAAETYRRLRRRPDLQPGELAAAAALYACIGMDDLPTVEVQRAATEALAVLESYDGEIGCDFLGVGGRHTVQFLGEAMLAVALLNEGDLVESARRFEKVLELPGAQYRIWKPYALGGLALGRALVGRCAEARTLATSAIDSAEVNGVRYHHGLAYAYFALALAALDQGEPDVVASSLHESEVRITRTGRAAFLALQRHLRIEQVAASEGAERALDLARASSRPVLGPALVADLQRAQELRLLIGAGRIASASTQLGPATSAGACVPEIIDLQLVSGDVAGARRTLDAWKPLDDLRAAVCHQLRTVGVLVAEGRSEMAVAALHEALHLAEPEGLRRPFLEHPVAMRLLRNEALRGSQSFARSIVAASTAGESRASGHERLIEPLTDRERDVLDYLPTRLSNSEIAAALFVSVNTLKSHLRHIYAKLAVADRDAAVAKASDLGLL